MVIDDTGSVEDIHAFIYCKKWRFGRVSRMPDRQTTLKDRATQLLIKYKSGALVTQSKVIVFRISCIPRGKEEEVISCLTFNNLPCC